MQRGSVPQQDIEMDGQVDGFVKKTKTSFTKTFKFHEHLRTNTLVERCFKGGFIPATGCMRKSRNLVTFS